MGIKFEIPCEIVQGNKEPLFLYRYTIKNCKHTFDIIISINERTGCSAKTNLVILVITSVKIIGKNEAIIIKNTENSDS